VADTVVCADGIKGVGRTTLLGEGKAALSTVSCSFVNICNKYKPEQARFIRNTLDPMYKFGAHPDQPTLFMIVPVDIPDLDKPEDWKYQTCLSTWGASQSDSNEERLRVFKEAASKYAEPWRSAVQWLPDDTYIPNDTIKYWANPVIWPNWSGKATLAGDGAHPIVPFRAQGLNNALQDAHNYVRALVDVRDGKKSLADAITVYGDEVLARGSAENKLSNMWGPVLHNWQAMMNTPMMKQGYGQSKKSEEAAKEYKQERPELPSKETATAEPAENAASAPQANEHSDQKPAHPSEVVVQEESVEHSVTAPFPLPHVNGHSTGEPAPIQSAEHSESAPSPPPQTNEHSDEKPANLEPPQSRATLAHGQYTPTEEHKSPGMSDIDRPLTPSSEEAPEDELAKLRKENEVLKRRNILLVEKLKAIQNLAVMVQEVGDLED
jgi:hypothetical protein